MNRPVNYSAQVDFRLVDQSIQKYDNIEHNDISIQPSFAYQDVSISMSKKDKSFGVSAAVSVKNQSNQLSVISQEDEEIQMGAEMIE